MVVRYRAIESKDNFTTTANTDIISDFTADTDGIIRLGIETTTTADVRITLNQSNFTTLVDSAAEIWAFFDIPIHAGDIFNIQTVDIEIISIRAVFISSTERD